MSSKFVHLHTHSHYSLLQALPQIPQLVAAAKKDGQEALALTDIANLYGAIEFYKECTKEGIKPIIGVECYVAPRTRHDKEHNTDDKTSRVVLLAKNNTGYQNLLQLVSKSHLEGFFYTPRVDTELLVQYKEGVVCIVPMHADSHEHAVWYNQTFANDCYLELTYHPELSGHSELTEATVALSHTLSIPLIAAHDVYYLHKSDHQARELVVHIGTATPMLGDEADRPDDFSFVTQESAVQHFGIYPEALANTLKVAHECTVELTLGHWILPNVQKPDDKTYDEVLRSMAEAGFAARGLQRTDEELTRMNYELDIIKTKGFASYFLAVADLLQSAKKMGIYTNTRGSAAGSLVSYLTGVITVNPLTFNLPFERFLNPERPSAPDIDMDLADNRRDDLITYAKERYGANHVAQIGTFGTMAARAAVRDVARALGYSYSKGDQIAKLIPFGAQGFPMTIEKALDIEPELKTEYQKDPETHEILDLAQKIEGNARHLGVHAAGVVIAPEPVMHYAPIQEDPKGEGKIITQYDMYSIADEYGGVGLLKFDFLGLKNLTVLADSIARVQKNHDVSIDVDTIPLNDEKTFEMLSSGRTMGVFQMASAGMTRWLVELRPSTIHDINAMVALYRPGPMEFIPLYIERKRDPRKVTYLDPRLEKFLAPTFGILIYQDDVMLIAVELAGYSWGEVDNFRKAMGKKIPEEMAKQHDKFLTGCVSHGMAEDAAKKLWDQIETFAAYGFNKSHSVSYGNLAYKTAYMKANYPLEFMSALLTADSGDVDEIYAMVEECKKMHIDILPPDVNESNVDFATVPGKRAIRFGLMSIKNFGEGIARSIVAERETHGPYKDVADVLTRVTDHNLNKRALEALIKSGAFDSFDDRATLLSNLEKLVAFNKEVGKNDAQDSLFGPATHTLVLDQSLPQKTQGELLVYEKELERAHNE
jgi:DNA polymerase-3 subunit alpha